MNLKEIIFHAPFPAADLFFLLLVNHASPAHTILKGGVYA
jgi:hypothetical protein